jgi:hypothetical protein
VIQRFQQTEIVFPRVFAISKYLLTVVCKPTQGSRPDDQFPVAEMALRQSQKKRRRDSRHVFESVTIHLTTEAIDPAESGTKLKNSI